jgi:hypothetical protein
MIGLVVNVAFYCQRRYFRAAQPEVVGVDIRSDGAFSLSPKL